LELLLGYIYYNIYNAEKETLGNVDIELLKKAVEYNNLLAIYEMHTTFGSYLYYINLLVAKNHGSQTHQLQSYLYFYVRKIFAMSY